MKSVFVVQHLHRLSDTNDDVKLIAIYESREAAIASIKRLSKQLGFRDSPRIVDSKKDEDIQGFHLDKYELGQDHWQDGFITAP